MKKLLLAVSLLLLSWGSVQAQQVRVGLKAGFNSANVSGDMGTFQDFDKDRRPGFSVGVLGNYLFTNPLAVQAELAYSTKGFKIDDTRTSDNDNTETKTEIIGQINYLDLPLLVQVRATNIYLEAGPQFSFLLNQKTETRVTTREKDLLGNWREPEKAPVVRNTSTSGYRPLDTGYVVGLGFRSPDSPLSFALRYSNSLRSFLEDPDTDARHSLFQVSVTGYLPVFGR